MNQSLGERFNSLNLEMRLLGTWAIVALLVSFLSNTITAQTVPPNSVFQKGLWANVHHYTGQSITQDKSGEDWPYQIIPSVDMQGKREGYVLAGFASFTDIPYRMNVCNTAFTPTSGQLECPGKVKGEHRASLFKIDEDGTMLWHKSFGGDEFAEFYSVTQSADHQYYYACGWTESHSMHHNSVGGSILPPPNPCTVGVSPIPYYYPNRMKSFYVVKVDHQGNIVWEHTYGEETIDAYAYEGLAYDIIENSDGNLIVVGRMDFRRDINSPPAYSNLERQHYRVLINGSTGDKINSVSGGAINSVQYAMGIVRTQNANEEYAVLLYCENQSPNTRTMIFTMAPDLDIMQSVKLINPSAFQIGDLAAGHKGYSMDIRKHNGEIVVGSVAGSKGFILRVDPTTLNLISALEFDNQLKAFDLKVGITATSNNEIAVVSSSMKGRATHTNETYTGEPGPTDIFWTCMNEYVTYELSFYGSDAILAVTKNNGTAIDFVQTYEHPGPFGTTFGTNVKQQECMYRIVEAPDGGLLACGNDSRNFDDYYIIKWEKPCSQSFSALDYTCPGGICNITSSTTLTGNNSTGTKVNGKIRVLPNVTLTINGGIWRFSSTTPSGFIIEPGGKLIINNAILTNLCYDMWSGIQVLGNSYMPENPLNQGMLVLNNTKLENAYRGVYVGDEFNTSLNGGIVNCDNSTFTNCRVAIYFNSYAVQRNLSYIQDSRFATTAPIINSQVINGKRHGPYAYISMFYTNGVRITGSTFENLTAGHPFIDDYRGTGILAIESSFRAMRTMVSGQPGGYPCTLPQGAPNRFINLSKGIATIGFTNTNWCKIIENEFINNSIGIELNGYANNVVYENTMQWDDQFIDDSQIPYTCGISFDSEDRFLCEANEFNFNLNTLQEHRNIHTQNIDDGILNTYSHVYRNTAINHITSQGFTVGHWFSGDNGDLQVSCNSYIDQVLDWQISGPFTQTQLISAQDPGNNFSSGPNHILDINNQGFNFIYFTPNPLSFGGSVIQLLPNVPANCPITAPCAAYSNLGQVLPGDEYTGEWIQEGKTIRLESEIADEIQRGNFYVAKELLNDYPETVLEDIDQKLLLEIMLELYQYKSDWAKIKESQIEKLKQFASHTTSAAGKARILLHLSGISVKMEKEQLSQLGMGQTAIQTEMNSYNLKVFPNPAATELHIAIQGIQASSFCIYDIKGAIIKIQGRLESQEAKVDVRSLIPGVYVLCVMDNMNEIISQQKVIIVR